MHGNKDQEHQRNPDGECNESRLPVTIEAWRVEVKEVVVIIIVILLIVVLGLILRQSVVRKEVARDRNCNE